VIAEKLQFNGQSDNLQATSEQILCVQGRTTQPPTRSGGIWHSSLRAEGRRPSWCRWLWAAVGLCLPILNLWSTVVDVCDGNRWPNNALWWTGNIVRVDEELGWGGG